MPQFSALDNYHVFAKKKKKKKSHNAAVTPSLKAIPSESRKVISAKWCGTWLSRGSYGVYVAFGNYWVFVAVTGCTQTM